MSNINVNAYCEAHGVSKQTSMDLQQAIGGTYQLPDGRSFWVDAVTVREIMSRIAPVIGAAVETAGRFARHSPSPQDHVVGLSDKELLDVLASNSWDLRCISVPTGGDDHDIDWVIIEHHQAEPRERTIAQAYADDPRAAIRRAIRENDKNAARCVSCDEVLHDGDSVYYEHGEGGHIHSWCASDDPESFVDEDEVPLKAVDEIPEPFAYSVETYEGQP